MNMSSAIFKIYAFLSLSFFLSYACQSEVDAPSPPKAPNVKKDAQDLLMPNGTLNSEQMVELADWIQQDANLFILVSPLIADTLINLVQGVIQGEDPTQSASMTGQSEVSEAQGVGRSAQQAFSGGGWFKITLACNRLEAIFNQSSSASTEDLGNIVLYTTFDSTHISPVIWGEANDCRMNINNLSVTLDADLSFFLPSDTVFIDDDWTLAKNRWVNFSGSAQINQSSYQGDQKLMVDQNDWFWLLWQKGDDAFAVSKSPELTDFSTFVVASQTGLWDCDLAQRYCLNRTNQESVSW